MRDYTDSQGRMFKVIMPDGDENLKHGLIYGPPLLDELELPTAMKLKLHNELFYRGLFTIADVRARRSELVSAIQSVFAVTAEKIEEIYSA